MNQLITKTQTTLQVSTCTTYIPIMATSSSKLIILLLSQILFSLFKIATSIDSITQSQSILDNNTTLVSKNGTFELGFFSPGNSTNRYIGIWYKFIPIQTVFWVANRNNPINDSSGALALNQTGNLLLNQNNTLVWSARLLKQLRNPVLQLLDTGNLVLREENDENPDNYSWQSFDYPTDTLIPGMKLGWDLKNKIDRRVTAWKNPNDPSAGNLSWTMELHNYPETVTWMGSKEYVRHGPWNGITVSSKPPNALPLVKFNSTVNDNEVYYDYTVPNKSLTVLMVMNQSSNMRDINIWSPEKQIWRLYATLPRDQCDNYALCGPYGYCDVSKTPNCVCLQGFKAKSPEKWNSLQPNFTDGCERAKPLSCAVNDIGFRRISEMKAPDTTRTWVNKSMNLEECRIKCLSNCSCSAYGNTDISGSGSGCVNWLGDIIDLKVIPTGGQDIYLRMPASELRSHSSKGKKIGVAIGCAIAGVLAILLLGFCFCRKKSNIIGKEDKGDLELPLFDLSTITSATDNFSINNKLGEGGFGPVYKGRLANGQEIAVKRLSKNSGQGLNEFKNEVILIAKLQHRNLVKLLGCCIQEDEKMLVYEYMPNKSLDAFIFDQAHGKQLSWSTWFRIICGVARGLLYLHQDSRLRIIHRDLKASNVLLDLDMNPKISDFGIARTFGADETEANTKRVVGTYGYMAPEYAIDGQFSVKSDVFSFGILMLEMISGKRNRGFYRPNNNDLNLIGYAWRLWKEGRPAELIDETFGDSLTMSEVLRCIHIGLLCVQQQPEDRPTMSAVVMMLSNENTVLSQPKQPGFFMEEDFGEKHFRSTNDHLNTTNEMTITVLEAR